MRRQDWPEILPRVLEEWREKPFCWGKSDCVQFAARAADAMLDYDLPGCLGPRHFANERQAQVYFKTAFAGKIENIFDAVLRRHASPAFARQGDIVMAKNEGQHIAGIVAPGGRRVAVKAKSGIVYLPVSAIVTAWVTE